MIHFSETDLSDYFNRNIHMFLTTEYIELRDADDPYDSLDLFFPKYMLREQKDKCLSIAEDLYYWSGDNFTHKLTPIHESGLYNFLLRVQEYKSDIGRDFDDIYYNNSDDTKAVKQAWDQLDKESYRDLFTTIKGFRRFIHDIDTMINYCFEDIDFITFPYLLGNAPDDHRTPAIVDLASYYSDLLPIDISKEYEQLGKDSNSSSLFENTGTILDQLSHNVTYRNYYKSFWNKDSEPLGEVDICARLEPILFSYFQGTEVEIDREVDTGIGKIDFRLKRYPTETVLLEIKLGNSKNLLAGYTKQLTHYMEAERCLNAYYVIVCRNHEELKKAEKFVKNRPPLIDRKITIKLLNVAPKISPSKLR